MTPDINPDAAVVKAPPPVASAPAGAEGERFPLSDRVRRRQDYLAIYEHGVRLSGSLMTVFFHRNTLGRTRLGIAATRKIGPAIGRNRAKRRIREVYRRNKFGDSVDIVVIPRRELIAAPFERIEAEFRGILKRRRRGSRG